MMCEYLFRLKSGCSIFSYHKKKTIKRFLTAVGNVLFSKYAIRNSVLYQLQDGVFLGKNPKVLQNEIAFEIFMVYIIIDIVCITMPFCGQMKYSEGNPSF